MNGDQTERALQPFAPGLSSYSLRRSRCLDFSSVAVADRLLQRSKQEHNPSRVIHGGAGWSACAVPIPEFGTAPSPRCSDVEVRYDWQSTLHSQHQLHRQTRVGDPTDGWRFLLPSPALGLLRTPVTCRCYDGLLGSSNRPVSPTESSHVTWLSRWF